MRNGSDVIGSGGNQNLHRLGGVSGFGGMSMNSWDVTVLLTWAAVYIGLFGGACIVSLFLAHAGEPTSAWLWCDVLDLCPS